MVAVLPTGSMLSKTVISATPNASKVVIVPTPSDPSWKAVAEESSVIGKLDAVEVGKPDLAKLSDT